MGDNRARRLLRTVKRAAYLVAVAPGVGRLPAALSYRMACWRGDWHFRCQAGKRTEMARNLEQVLGDELSPAAVQQVTREWFRLGSCGAVDLMRLRRGARPLRRLVEIRGGNIWRPRWPRAREPSFAPATSTPTTMASRCCTPAASRSPPSGAGGTTTTPVSHPPSGGCWIFTSGRCGATGSGRTSSHGLAGPRSRRWQPPRSALMRW